MITVVRAFLGRYGYAILALVWLATLGYAIYKTQEITTNRIELKQVKEVVRIVEKRNEIANHRPDTRAVIDGLRSDPNW